MRSKRSAIVVAAAVLGLSIGTWAPAYAVDVIPGEPDERTDLVVYHDDGSWTGSTNPHEPRSALSLIKLYLGYWVLEHGTEEEKGTVLRMIRSSSDEVAIELDAAYPDAINEVAEEFELEDTTCDGYWGKAVTSPYDIAKFVSETKDDPIAEPLFRGMANHAPYAEDGFKQDFGTAQMAGVIGTKFGWSNDREGAFASVSYGPGWVIAAMTYGDVDEHTDDVHEWIDQAPVGASLPVTPGVTRGLDNGAQYLRYWLVGRGDKTWLQPTETIKS